MTILLQSSVPRDRSSSRNVMVLVQTYGISRSHLNYLHRRYTASIMLQTSLVRWVTKHNNYWDDCIKEMNVVQSISDILLLPSRLYFESECDGLSSDLWYLQISFELLTSASIMLQTSLVRWVTKHNNYWDDCIKEMNVAQSISDILLHPSRLYLES